MKKPAGVSEPVLRINWEEKAEKQFVEIQFLEHSMKNMADYITYLQEANMRNERLLADRQNQIDTLAKVVTELRGRPLPKKWGLSTRYQN
jgi:flagellar biosynthesis/type III secretory pathway chaperone